MNILILLLAIQDVDDLEARAVAWAAQRKLDCTDDQARAILDLAKEADRARVEYEAKIAALRKEQLKAFTAFREEDLKNAGFTPSVERAAGSAEHEEKVLGKAYADRIEAIAKRSPVTVDFELRIEPLLLAKAPPLRPELANFVRKLCSKTPAEFERQREALRDEFLRVIDARTSEVDDLASFLAAIDDAMKQIREGGDVVRIIRKAAPRTREELLREGLGEIHKQKYGEIGPTGRFLLLPALIEVLSKRLHVRVEKNPTPTGSTSGG